MTAHRTDLHDVTGLAPRSKFDDAVQRKSRLLRHALVSYLGAASEFTEEDLTLVLSPLTALPRSEEQRGQFSGMWSVSLSMNHQSNSSLAAVPTLGDALQALNELCNEVQEAFTQLRYVAAELATRDTVRVDNVEEVSGWAMWRLKISLREGHRSSATSTRKCCVGLRLGGSVL